MRHGNSGRRLGRNSSHRDALWANLVTSLFTYGRIETTEAKAKELRKHADDTISWGVSVSSLVAKGDKASAADKVKIVHAHRMARKVVKTKGALERLFKEIGPHFAESKKTGGYTRIIKSKIRKGDAASMALVVLPGLEPEL
jgi:large subunit ribosomal protein L17